MILPAWLLRHQLKDDDGDERYQQPQKKRRLGNSSSPTLVHAPIAASRAGMLKVDDGDDDEEDNVPVLTSRSPCCCVPGSINRELTCLSLPVSEVSWSNCISNGEDIMTNAVANEEEGEEQSIVSVTLSLSDIDDDDEAIALDEIPSEPLLSFSPAELSCSNTRKPAWSLTTQQEQEPQSQSNAMILTFPDEILATIGSFLNLGSLKVSRLVCHKFCRVLSTDDAGWGVHCQRLWRRKAQVARAFTNLISSHDNSNNNLETNTGNTTTACATLSIRPPYYSLFQAFEAYQQSCMDARLRHEITVEELIYDPAAGLHNVWEFRFKEAAGMEWTCYDPWYQGAPPRKMVFLKDGTVRQLFNETVDESDEINNNNSNSHATTTTTTMAPQLRLPFHDSSDPEGVSITWRFIAQPMDLPRKATGAYVRLTVGGRDVPAYVVHRSPTGNWGFLLENCWGVFASFPLPPRRMSPDRDEEFLVRRLARNHLVASTTTAVSVRPPRRISVPTVMGDGNNNVVHTIEDDGDYDENLLLLLKTLRKRELLEDDSLSVTNRWQWREALMYNLGSASLPDGPTAASDFDRAWETAIQRLSLFGFSSTVVDQQNNNTPVAALPPGGLNRM